MIIVNVQQQRLDYLQDNNILAQYPVSTARLGVGEQKNSEQTPRGRHSIRAKIGADCPINTVFQARRPTGEIWTPTLNAAYPHRDWVLTRILWLSGLEAGFNRLGSVDSMQRYIYIHGTPDDQPMGQALSHGCVRMRNRDIMELFAQVAIFEQVLIKE